MGYELRGERRIEWLMRDVVNEIEVWEEGGKEE